MATQKKELLGDCLHVAFRDPIKLRKPLLLKALEKSSKKEAPIITQDDDVVGSFVLALTDKPPLLKSYPSRRGFIQFHNSKIIDDETVVAECRLIFFRMAEKTPDSGDHLDLYTMLALLKDLVYDWPTVYATAMPALPPAAAAEAAAIAAVARLRERADALEAARARLAEAHAAEAAAAEAVARLSEQRAAALQGGAARLVEALTCPLTGRLFRDPVVVAEIGRASCRERV